MDNYLLGGILIGLMFGIPVGAIGAITVQRTLNYGIKAGLLTGLGSSIADCMYACIGAFSLTLVSEFLLNYQNIINILGGSLILMMGIRMILRKNEGTIIQVPRFSDTKMFLLSFGVGITNPTVILTFLFAFSYFRISGQLNIFQGVQLILGVFIGTYIWWGTLSVAVNRLRKKMKENSDYKLNRIFGVILMLFGTAIFIRTIL